MNGKVKQLADASIEKIGSLEKRLSGAFKQIKPRQEFVHGVAERIQANSHAALLVERITSWRLIAIVVAAIVSLAVFLALLGRALAALLGKKPTV